MSGIGVSPGYAIGRVHLVDRRKLRIPRRRLEAGEIEAEVQRLMAAIDTSEEQIQSLRDKLERAGEEHYLILEAHQLMIRDEMLVDGTCQLIRNQQLNAEWALQKALRGIKRVFDNIEDEYFRERRSDVDFVGDRLTRNLMGEAQPSLSTVKAGEIVVGHDLAPSDTTFLMQANIAGFITELGGKTSHTAIIARSLELPAVVAVEGVMDRVAMGDTLIVDGSSGEVLINPSTAELERYRALADRYARARARLDRTGHGVTQTKDGVQVTVRGNIELPEETKVVLSHGAAGIGLYRTEFLFMNRRDLPDEDEQFECYRAVLEQTAPHPATIRTLDLGGDKLADAMRRGVGPNPVLGLRAVRLCLDDQALFKTQLRALLRASAFGQLRIMVPLISRIDEVRHVKGLMAECRAELVREGHDLAPQIDFGIMIEVPAAALLADHLAREVDFFSIGTNDLIQYTLAVDRQNQHVAHLYAPLHPAMLRLLSGIIRAAHAGDIEVTMCGEMAGEPLYLPVLLGMGLRVLSMNPTSVPVVRHLVSALSVPDCVRLFDALLALDNTNAIEAHTRRTLRTMLRDTDALELLGAALDQTQFATPADGIPAQASIQERRTLPQPIQVIPEEGPHRR